MNQLLQSPPKTIMEVFKMLPEGTLAELIDNQIYMTASPFGAHQRLQMKLSAKIFNFLEKHNIGEVVSAPMDVYLDETSNAVQPDIFVLLNENQHILHPNGHVRGVPDLIIEILSPGNRNHDLVRKKELYERFRVKEYIITDPDNKDVWHYVLVNNIFEQQPATPGQFTSRLLQTSFSF
jgi:Uma2 family endonuclease